MSAKESNEAPKLEGGTVNVEIMPDLRKLRSFATDLIALIDRYWPESADMGETDRGAGSPEKTDTFTTDRVY